MIITTMIITPMAMTTAIMATTGAAMAIITITRRRMTGAMAWVSA